ncbi:MAG: UDP-2,3-diacylglucosamine diphosphatase [Phycisphaeraceae bacterium]|nr:UDP-2,3-diacylglucosamine diphosphatase [Phycisphaeraceae bacterium]
MSFSYRSVFLSDTHLGFAGVHAAELSAFLKHLQCERLYLVGDIVDLWALRSRWRWPVMHNQVVRRVLKLAKKGVVVTYIPGNHDDALRQYIGIDLGGVRIAKQAAHRTVDGRLLLVTHGDEYDLVVQHSRMLALVGTWAYDRLIALNRIVNGLRSCVGLPKWSFSGTVKARVKGACTYISRFEQALLTEARRRGMNGVICGHIHQPLIQETTESDGSVSLYANCGDWIERTSLLVEHHDGRFEILDAAAELQNAGITIPTIPEEGVVIADDPQLELAF